jgi:hypothetical protein
MTRSRRLAHALLAFVVLLLAACATGPTGSVSKRDLILEGYGAAIRWNDFDGAMEFIDPFYRQEHPLDDFQRERYKQIQVTGYEVRNIALSPDGMTLQQNVELRLINRHTQVERTLLDRQRWRFDPISKRWWLESGLPDLDAK